MGLNYYASSPTLVLPPQHLSRPFTRHANDTAMADNCTAIPSPSARKFVPKIPTPPSLNYLAQAFNGAAGRKRSRADIGEDLDDGMESSSGESLSKATIESSSSFNTKTFTDDKQPKDLDQWSATLPGLEEHSVAQHAASIMERPRLTARKSQRRIIDAPEDATISDAEIDPIIRKLGIGWKLIQDSQSPAIAGQQAFIRNQFSFEDPQIVLQHEGLGIFIVRSTPASAQGYWDQWWLFTDDLKTCRFLCRDETELFRRLNNKRQDDRGIWQPEIIVEGPVIRAKDAAAVASGQDEELVFATDITHASFAQLIQVDKDVQMVM